MRTTAAFLLAFGFALHLTLPALAGEDPPLPPVPIPPRIEQADNLYDGYRWFDYAWVPGYIDVATWYRRAPLYSYGSAVFYGPNVMEGTARYRGLSLRGYVDGVAMMSPADIGRTVWLRREGLDWEGPFLVVDCAQRDDMWPIVRYRKEVIEVGFETAKRWGMAVWHGGNTWQAIAWRVDVEVWVGEAVPRWLTEPAWAGYVADPVYYPLWFVEGAKFTTRSTDSREPLAKENGCWLFRDEDRLMCPEDWPAEPLNWRE